MSQQGHTELVRHGDRGVTAVGCDGHARVLLREEHEEVAEITSMGANREGGHVGTDRVVS
jgi:hypothetical protein